MKIHEILEKERRENGEINLRRMIRGKIGKNTWNKSRGVSNKLSTKHYHLSLRCNLLKLVDELER